MKDTIGYYRILLVDRIMSWWSWWYYMIWNDMIWNDMTWYGMKWHGRQWYRRIYRHRVFQMCTCKHHFCAFHFFEVSVFPSSTMMSSWAEFAGDGVELVRIPDESSAHRPGMDHPGPSWTILNGPTRYPNVEDCCGTPLSMSWCMPTMASRCAC